MWGELPLTNTIGVVSRYFSAAEEAVRRVVAEVRPNACEEVITADLQRELHAEFQRTGGSREVGYAFVKDVMAAKLGVNLRELHHRAEGLIAEVSWHSKKAEGSSGGDFGLVLVRPRVTRVAKGVAVNPGHQQGLLVQAKRKGWRCRWGRFSKPQRRLLPDRLSYTSLLLYRFQSARQLAPFGWYPCNGSTFEQIKECLRRDTFEKLDTSSDVLTSLGKGKIGTSDRDIIEKIISPEDQNTLIIRIDWRGDPPGGFLLAHVGTGPQRQQVKVYQPRR